MYGLMLERLELAYFANVTGAAVARAMGASPEMPDLDDVIASFDAELAAPPRRVDPKRYDLERALGVGTYGRKPR